MQTAPSDARSSSQASVRPSDLPDNSLSACTASSSDTFAFFNSYNKEVIARMLFVFGKLNRGVQYVQGMNELVAPLLYVFAESEMENVR